MKLESLVIVNQHVTVNTFPSLVHRPSSQGSRECPKSVLVAADGKLDNKD